MTDQLSSMTKVKEQKKGIGYLLISMLLMTTVYSAPFSWNFHSVRYSQKVISPSWNSYESQSIIQLVEKRKYHSKKDSYQSRIFRHQVIPKYSHTLFTHRIPMPIRYQKYLYEMSKKRGLSYQETLAVINHESSFDPNKISPSMDYGYFQVNEINFSALAKKLRTAPRPLNPYINIDWGTYLLAHLYHYWEKQGLKGNVLHEAVWSSYNEGITGYYRNGIETTYVQKTIQSLKYIQSRF